jgi:hypothetical protein
MFIDVSNVATRGDVSPKAKGRVHGVPLQPGALTADVAEMLAEGHWLGDVEALDKGDFALWIEHESRLLGVRVHADGRIEVGPRSAVAVVHRTAGLRSLSWSPGGASFESIDGGMHYTQIGLPATDTVPEGRSKPSPIPAAKPGAIATDAGCTAIGCILPTLVRVGWGAELARAAEPERPRPSPSGVSSAAHIALQCALVSRASDDTKTPTPKSPAHGRPISITPHMPYSVYGGTGTGAEPFYGMAAPKVRADQMMQGWDMTDLADRRSATFLGRVYLWGAVAIGADPDSGWQWRWYDARTHGVHASAIAKPPDEVSVQHQMQSSMMSRASWAAVASNDPRRAVGFHSDNTRTLVFSLVEGEAPSAIELEDGTSFGMLDAGIAAPGDRTVLAGAVGDPAGTAIYLAQGARAERVARIPRVGVQGKPSPALVALHTDGVRIAIAVEDHEVTSRMDAAFYVREAYPSDGPIRRYGITRALRACAPDSPGFEAWAKLDLASELTVQGAARMAHLQTPTRARLRFGDDGSLCIAEATSDVDGEGATALASLPMRAATPGAVPLTIGHGGRHYTLACSAGIDR